MELLIKTRPLITLSPVMHRGQDWILIQAPKLEKIQTVLNTLLGSRYTKTYKAWVVPLSKENYKISFYALEPVATLETSAMKKWFSEHANKATTALDAAEPAVKETFAAAKTVTRAASHKTQAKAISVHIVNEHVLPCMEQQLQLNSYSKSTQRTYLNEMAQFLKAIRHEPAESFTVQRLKEYLQYCYATLCISENTIHSRMNAMKYYYEQVLKREKLFFLNTPTKENLYTTKSAGRG